MPRDGAIIFRDLVGKLGMLRIERDKCGRAGNYRLARLIAKYGADAKLFEWTDDITADCPRKRNEPQRHMWGAISGSADVGGDPRPVAWQGGALAPSRDPKSVHRGKVMVLPYLTDRG